MRQIFASIRKRPFALFFCIFLLHTLFSFYYIKQQNITYDEPHYIEYAKRWLHGHPERAFPLDDSKSPVIAVCWVPRIIRQIVNPDYRLNDYGRKDQAEGRYMMILFSFFGACYVYRWCKDLYGVNGWFLPLVLLLFDPLYLAYSTLITTDLACGALLVAVLYHFRKVLTSYTTKDFLLSGMYTGIAIITKQTLLFLLILLPLISVLYHLKYTSSVISNYRRISLRLFFFVIIVIFVVNLSFYFTDTFIPFGNYVFESNTFRSLQHSLPSLKGVPVPFPAPFIQSIDLIKAHAEIGAGNENSTYNGVYLFGKLHLKTGFWYYYFVTFFYKTPVSILLFILVGAYFFVSNFYYTKQLSATNLFIILPIVFYWIILSFFNNFQTGIRHMLVIFPLMYIAVGKVVHTLLCNKIYIKIGVVVLIAYFFGSVFSYYPYIIPYTNEFVTDKKEVYIIMMDSGIDYGQSDSSVTRFLSTHHDYQSAVEQPSTGKFILPMGKLVDLKLWDKNPYKWFQQYKPTGLYRNVILLYEIKANDVNAKQ